MSSMTLGAVYDEVVAGPSFCQRAPATQASWQYLRQHLPVRVRVATATASQLRTELSRFDDRPGLRRRLRALISYLLTYAHTQGYRREPPPHVPNSAGAIGSITRWTRAQVKRAIEDTTDAELRLAIALMYFTGQRLSDVVRLSPAHIIQSDGAYFLAIKQQKTGAEVSAQIIWQVACCLPHLDPSRRWVTSPPGTLRKRWERVRDRLGLSGLSLHGLRKSAACEAAEGGASVPELQALGGWRSVNTAAIYFAQADRARLARSATDKRFIGE